KRHGARARRWETSSSRREAGGNPSRAPPPRSRATPDRRPSAGLGRWSELLASRAHTRREPGPTRDSAGKPRPPGKEPRRGRSIGAPPGRLSRTRRRPRRIDRPSKRGLRRSWRSKSLPPRGERRKVAKLRTPRAALFRSIDAAYRPNDLGERVGGLE